MGTVGEFTLPELRRSAALVFEIAAFSALGASLAWLMWSVVEPVGPVSTTGAALPATAALEKLEARLAQLPQISMGGGTGVAPAQIASDFVLHATRAGVDGGGAAILSVNGAPHASFSVGDEVATGARLVLVAADHVEIDAGGQRLRVEFSGGARAPIVSPSVPSPTATQLLNSAPLQPITRPGGRTAVAVTANADLARLGAPGLQPGDIILKIDGVDVSAANFANYATQLQSGRSFDVVFERNGQTSTTRIGKPVQ